MRSYREQVEQLKNYIVQRSASLSPNQDILPFWELISRKDENNTLVADPDGAAAQMIPDLARQYEASIVSHVMFCWHTMAEIRTEVAMVMVVDAERCELWTAPVVRSERSPIIGPWELFGGSNPNETVGGPVPDIQAALR